MTFTPILDSKELTDAERGRRPNLNTSGVSRLAL